MQRKSAGLLVATGVAVTAALWAQQPRRFVEPPVLQSVRGMRGAIAGGTTHGTEAGLRMYHLGGNAVDAGVSALLVGAVAEYSHFGFGGEAPILIRTKQGKVFAIAGVGTMPKSATAEFFRARKMLQGEFFPDAIERNGLKGMVPVAGVMPVLVPGMPEAAMVALREFGTRTLAEALQPAIELADAMPLDETRASTIARSKKFFELWPASKRYFMPEGRTQFIGEIFRQPELAATLRKLADADKHARAAGKSREQGIDAARDYFYRGEIAHKIADFIKQHNGILKYEDMAAFRLKPEEAASTTYRGYEVYKPGFWSQGPVLLQALNMLEASDLRALKLNSTEYLHRLVETMKLAYADRDTYYGDPKFAKVPAERLLSRPYAEERRGLVGSRGSFEFRPGVINGYVRIHPSESELVRLPIDDTLMAADTTCVDAIDKEGVMFASTPSGAWLPSVIVPDIGIPLTQRAQSFLLIKDHPNELAGGKRPRVTLSPTLVTRGGKPYMVFSTPGGDNQDQAMLQLFLDVVEFGMDAQEAVEAPRFQTRHLVSSFDNHAMNPGDLLLDERVAPNAVTELAARGHKVQSRSKWASGSAPVLIRMRANGVIEAGADPYGQRAAAAW
jgi:gamma-glutamyltranspeptidase / glutathione hydrolase